MSEYPEHPVGGFPVPPRTITDGEGRTIRLRELTDHEALVSMYLQFDPADKAQGIPPSTESVIREWLADITTDDAVNVVARADDRTVGHAVLVGESEPELAIFVLQAYQGAGVGTELLRTTLGEAAATGIDRVWLTVERWNHAAIALYTKLGFEQLDSPQFDIEMRIRLETE